MIEIKARLRRWGNSFGIVVPRKAIEKENIKEGEEVEVFFNKQKTNILKKMFGTFKFKKSTKKMMEEMDRELYND